MMNTDQLMQLRGIYVREIEERQAHLERLDQRIAEANLEESQEVNAELLDRAVFGQQEDQPEPISLEGAEPVLVQELSRDLTALCRRLERRGGRDYKRGALETIFDRHPELNDQARRVLTSVMHNCDAEAQLVIVGNSEVLEAVVWADHPDASEDDRELNDIDGLQ